MAYGLPRHPPIFQAMLRHRTYSRNMNVQAMARRFLIADGPVPRYVSNRLGDVIDGRFQTPNKHSHDL